MKAHWALSFVIVTALVSSMLPVSLSGNAQALVVSSHMIGSSGGSLTLDGAIFHLEGVNDQTVVPFQLYPYPAYHYRYSNHLFSSATGGYIGDTTTILNSDNMTDFWWQYFYLVHSLGLNCVRLGGFDWWGLSWLHSTYYNDRPTWDAVIDPMFAMAKETGVYIVFCFGGTTSNTYSFSKTTNEFGPSMQDPMAGSLFQVGSECYEHFVDWIGEVMNHYSSQLSLGMWEPLNEPDGDAAWTNYWSHLASPKESYRSWAENLTRDLNAIDHHHLLTIGSAVGGLMFTMNADTILANTNDADVCQSHVYGETRIGHGYGCVFGETGNESTFAAGRAETAAIGKPDFFGEVGYASVSPPWVMRYWPFLHNICIKYDINLCWLTLDTYPGYPISQERLASIPGSPTEPVGLAMAQDGDYTYELSGSPTVATISGYTGAGGAIVIPSTLGGYATVAIGSYAFQSKTSLTSVTIPSSVISIGQGAFSSCTALASVTIPNGVTTIGNYALQSCTSLTSVTIPSSVISIGGGAFYYCTSLASVTIGSGVTFIEGGAFCYCTSLASLSIPNTVTSFGDEAFSGCTALASVAISNSVTSIGKNAFQSCTSLTAISVGPGNPNYASVGGVLYNKAVTVLIQCPGGKAGAITIPNGVTTIGNYAFQSCISLTSVNIPNSVTSTGEGAFFGCIALTSVSIGSGTTSIGDGAFAYCALTSVTIPSTVTYLGSNAFASCTSLTSIDVNAGSANYANLDGVLYNKGLTTLIQCPGGKAGALSIPNSVTSIGSYAFQFCTSLTSVTIPNSVTSIGYYAFSSCSSLTSVTLPNSVTSIGYYAFSSCSSLSSVIIPSSVTYIMAGAFSGCTSLTSVTIPNSVTSIGNFAFQSCTSLTAISVGPGNPNYASVGGVLYNKAVTVLIQCPGGKAGAVTIPNGVTTIGNYAFQFCISMTSVTIPNSVISVGYFAFSYCISLTAINVDAGNPNYTSVDDVLYNKAINILIQYPGGRAGAVTIPNGVTTIGNYAFQSCISLTSVNIPSSVISIGGLAFHYCTALTSITFYGLVAPTIVGYGWILGTDAGIWGHAYAASNFPPPGDSFYNLTMGAVIPVAPVAPGAPTGLVATGGAGFVLLNWTAPTEAGNPGLTRYDVYRGTSSGIYGSPIGNVAAGTLTYNDTTVTPGTPFFYVVKAVNSVDSSPASNQVTGTATAPPSVPSAPQDIVGSAGAGYVRLTWAAPASNGGGTITNYKVYRGTTSGGETLLVTVENILTFTDSSLTNGQPYYYRVSAVNVAGEGPLSNEASATPATVPTAPTLNSATAGNGQVVLAWTAAPSNGGAAITGYNLYRGATPGGEMFLASLGNILALTDTDLTNGQTYYYKISAVNSVGEGAQSNELSATPITEPTAPTLSSAMPGNAQVVLVWTSPSDSGGSSVTAYKVYRGTTSGGESLLATLGNVLTYTDISVTNDQTYYYKVSAVNSVGEGELSTEASAAPGAVPSAPRGFQAIARDSAVDLNWTAPEYIGPGTLTCHLFRNGSEVWSGTGLTYTDTSVMNGITYSYQVAAENLLGWGLNCTAVQATPMAGEITPTPPRNLVVMVGNENVTLNWEEPLYSNASAVVGYMISYGTSPDSMPNHIVYDLLSIVLEGLTKGQIYYFKVAAQNSAGWGPNSTIASATPFGVPSIPLNLTAIAGNGNVTLNWTAPIYIDSPNVIYHIYRDLNLLPAWSGTALIWKDEGLVKGVFYHYKVVASNNVGWGLNSSEVSATPFGVPDEPTGLHAIAGAGQVDLNWTSSVYTGLGTITYHLFRDNALIWSGAEIMHTDTRLNKGQNYTYQVSASNSVGWGQNSTIISATPFGVPSVPIGLMAKSGDGYVTLNWSAPSYPGPSGLVYHLFRNGTMIWSGPLLAHNDSSVVNGVIYAYKVAAESLVGWGPNSSIVSAIPISPPILPGVPVGLQASVGDGQVTLSWTAPAHAGSSKILCYEVYWGTNSTSFVPSGTAFGTNCTITGVTNGHTYYYKVSAVNAAGEGNLTEAVSATPMAPTSNGSDLFVIVGGIAAVVVVAVIGGLFYLRRKK